MLLTKPLFEQVRQWLYLTSVRVTMWYGYDGTLDRYDFIINRTALITVSGNWVTEGFLSDIK